MSNAEIAAALYITACMAKTHVTRLLAKLGAKHRVQLVITAYQVDAEGQEPPWVRVRLVSGPNRGGARFLKATCVARGGTRVRR
jgi:hypothetical protein